MELFRLLGSIFVDNSDANKSIDATDKKAEGLGAKFKAGVATAGKWGAAIAGAAVASGGALFALTQKAAGTTDEIDKMSQKIGISREGYQELSYILSQNGTDVSVLQRGLKTLTERMDESTKGTGKGDEAFRRLNLTATDLNGNLKTQEQMLDEAAKALMKLPEGSEKSRLAFELFGRAGQELMPMLNGSAEGMDELRQAAHDMGLVISDEAVDSGVLFTDTMDNVKRSLGAVFTNIGVQLMPMFQTLADWILDHMPEIQEFTTKAFEMIGKFVTATVDIFTDYLLPIFQAVFEWTKENWPIIQAVIEGVFKAVKFVWDNVLGPVLGVLWDTFKGIVEWVQKTWPVISATFKTVFDAIKWVWDHTLGPVLGFLLDALKGVVGFVADRFSGMQRTVEKTFAGIGKAVEAVTKIFNGIIDAIRKAWDWLTKWNNTPAQNKTVTTTHRTIDTGTVQGSHATGLDYVPFDNYRANLHKGEAVLTAREASDYRQGRGGATFSRGAFEGAIIFDDYGVDRLMDRIKFRLGELGV